MQNGAEVHIESFFRSFLLQCLFENMFSLTNQNIFNVNMKTGSLFFLSLKTHVIHLIFLGNVIFVPGFQPSCFAFMSLV